MPLFAGTSAWTAKFATWRGQNQSLLILTSNSIMHTSPARHLVSLVVTIVVATVNASTITASAAETYRQYSSDAVNSTIQDFYVNGYWRECVAGCPSNNQDWGADSLTNTLFLHWKISHDAKVLPYFKALLVTAPLYPSCQGSSCKKWSDAPEWDSVAASRAYEATQEPEALTKAIAAYRSVEASTVFALGACPAIRYQQPYGAGGGLKTLETEANAIKAGLLLYRYTRTPAYLSAALKRYKAVRQFFLDPQVPLYTVYVFDDGKHCTQLRHRFFASVNGLMIYNGWQLWSLTRNATYLHDAEQTAAAVARYLSDPAHVYEDLQAENDIVEPLVESMYDLAVAGDADARSWIIGNANTAAWERESSGAFGRFFGGPPPAATITEWQANGGYSLMIAAGALAPTASPASRSGWSKARFVPVSIRALPASITFVGSRVALLGTLGEVCCQPGHARVFVDGVETFDQTGIWQNKSSSGRTNPNVVLFAWGWPSAGSHTLTLYPGIANPKEGGSFLHVQAYLVK
jgi:hypothetical protein